MLAESGKIESLATLCRLSSSCEPTATWRLIIVVGATLRWPSRKTRHAVTKLSFTLSSIGSGTHRRRRDTSAMENLWRFVLRSETAYDDECTSEMNRIKPWRSHRDFIILGNRAFLNPLNKAIGSVASKVVTMKCELLDGRWSLPRWTSLSGSSTTIWTRDEWWSMEYVECLNLLLQIVYCLSNTN